MNSKPVASLSLDLDNKWSYLKTHGDTEWDTFPSYLNRVIPRFLDVLEDLDLKITVFVVGQDAALEKNGDAIAEIAAAGHEIGNHTFKHEPWLHLYSPSQLQDELSMAEDAIENATGYRRIGFRGPGFSLSNEVLRTLIQRGYRYDCSTFPTFLGPAARAYYFMRSSLSAKQKEERKELFGSFTDGFQSNAPYCWRDSSSRLLELPVTTFPLIKTPIHLSYLLYLSKFSRLAARTYAWSAMMACRLSGVGPSLLLHPLDFLGVEDEPDLAFFPGMDLPAERKIELVVEVLEMMKQRFTVLPMIDHVCHIQDSTRLRERSVESATKGIAMVGVDG